MERGTVVMMDALGSKGSWKGKDDAYAQTLIDNLRELRRAAEEKVRKVAQEFRDKVDPSIEPLVAAISDTLVIGVSCKPTGGDDRERATRDAMTVFCASAATAAIIQSAAVLDPPLVFRGVVAFGKFIMDDRFVLGPAVDEVASLERTAEAAVVWLSPTATAVWAPAKLDPNDLGFVQWPVPMKGGGSYDTCVINPFHWLTGADSAGKRSVIARRILDRFSDERVEVQIKKQNTKRLLDAAEKVAEKS